MALTWTARMLCGVPAHSMYRSSWRRVMVLSGCGGNSTPTCAMHVVRLRQQQHTLLTLVQRDFNTVSWRSCLQTRLSCTTTTSIGAGLSIGSTLRAFMNQRPSHDRAHLPRFTLSTTAIRRKSATASSATTTTVASTHKGDIKLRCNMVYDHPGLPRLIIEL